MTDNFGMLVFSESSDALLELLAAGRSLLDGNGGRLTAVAIGSAATAAAPDWLARGADEVVLIATPTANSTAEDFAFGLREAARAVNPDMILIAATRIGADVAARLAQMLEAPCASNCTALRRDESGNLEIERRVYGGRFTALQVFTGRPQIASVPLGRFARAEQLAQTHGTTRELAVSFPAPRVRVQAISPRVRSAVDVTKADVIVAAGRGVKKMEDLALLDRLAAVLGGVLAGSRPLTGDVDWLPTDRRIGLSGQTVKPNLYIACGISGQIEHIVGMKGARTVVAINSDPKAPIHAEADYSIVGNLYDVVPAFLEAYQRARRT